MSYAGIEQYEKAISLWKETIERNPDYLFAYMGLTIAYYLSGNETKAREAAVEVLRIKPTLSMDALKKRTSTLKDKEFQKRVLGAYRKSGIPEHSSQKASD